MSHASDATQSPTENQAGDSVWKYSDQSVCICVVGPGEELWEAQVYPSKMSWNLGLKAALEIITEDSSFQDLKPKHWGQGEVSDVAKVTQLRVARHKVQNDALSWNILLH